MVLLDPMVTHQTCIQTYKMVHLQSVAFGVVVSFSLFSFSLQQKKTKKTPSFHCHFDTATEK